MSLSSLAYGGAWPMPAGKGQIISTNILNKASRAYDERWSLSQQTEFSKTESGFYWEHGVSSKLTFVATTAWQDIEFLSREGLKDVEGFGTSSLGVRYVAHQDNKAVYSLQARALFAGDGEVVPDADLGRGGNGIELRALAGRNYKAFGRTGFLDLQTAWTIRSGEGPQSLNFDATAGLNITGHHTLMGQLFYTLTGEQILGLDRILPNESVKIQGSMVIHRSKRTSIQAGFFRTVAGRNVVREGGTFAGVWRRY